MRAESKVLKFFHKKRVNLITTSPALEFPNVWSISSQVSKSNADEKFKNSKEISKNVMRLNFFILK